MASTFHSRESSSSDTDSFPDSQTIDFTQEDTEWADIEPDNGETLHYLSLVDDKTFDNLHSMLDYCKAYGLDVRGRIHELALDFYGAVKMVNFLRSELAAEMVLDLSDPARWADDKYMHPYLEDDAVLLSLDELLLEVEAETTEAGSETQSQGADEMARLKMELKMLQKSFAEYRVAVDETMEKRWSDCVGPSRTNHKEKENKAEGSRAPASSLGSAEKNLQGNGERDDDSHYFDSYSYNDIHETMLKDTIRTSSYRDFIYTHKNLFTHRTILDVGTGTGILSLFAARAGAKRVFAVDNSGIISKAREIVASNGLDAVVKCVRGKVEDVVLPFPPATVVNGEKDVAKVDVIISEWMGYCLLYESMLDSVLSARDRFLSPSGLLAPSHMTLRIAPVADPEYIEDSIGFWSEVYGFDMNAMTEKITEDVVVRSVSPDCLIAEGATFKRLNLYTVQVGELEFEESFEVEVTKDVDGLDGWVIWFDTYFLAERDGTLEDEAVAEVWPGNGREDKGVAFTTGPGGGETHWRAGFCVVDHAGKGKKLEGKAKFAKKPTPLKKGMRIVGGVGYRKRESNSRELDIEIWWEVAGEERERGRQVWCMR